MGTKEDQPNPTGGLLDPSLGPLRCAALAARLLEDTCARGPGDPLRLGVVRMLARYLKVEIEVLAGLADRETAVVEGALRAADVANLAASTLADLPGPRAPEAAPGPCTPSLKRASPVCQESGDGARPGTQGV